jgi:hypothetical protein
LIARLPKLGCFFICLFAADISIKITRKQRRMNVIMSTAIAKYIRGSCPVFNAGQTITVKYVSKDFNPVSMVCECESDCTLHPCPIKRAILSMVD